MAARPGTIIAETDHANKNIVKRASPEYYMSEVLMRDHVPVPV